MEVSNGNFAFSANETDEARSFIQKASEGNLVAKRSFVMSVSFDETGACSVLIRPADKDGQPVLESISTGELFMRLLVQSGLKTQRAFAKKVGVSQPHFWKLVNGKIQPREKTVTSIAQALEIPLTDPTIIALLKACERTRFRRSYKK